MRRSQRNTQNNTQMNTQRNTQNNTQRKKSQRSKWTRWFKTKPRNNNTGGVHIVPAPNRTSPAKSLHKPKTNDTRRNTLAVSTPRTSNNNPKISKYASTTATAPKFQANTNRLQLFANNIGRQLRNEEYKPLSARSNAKLERLRKNYAKATSVAREARDQTHHTNDERAKAAAGWLQLFANDIGRQLRHEEYKPLSTRNNAKLEQLRKNYAKATSIAREAQGQPVEKIAGIFTRLGDEIKRIENRATTRSSRGPLVIVKRQARAKPTPIYDIHDPRSRHAQAMKAYSKLDIPTLKGLRNDLLSISQNHRFPKAARTEAQIMLPALYNVIQDPAYRMSLHEAHEWMKHYNETKGLLSTQENGRSKRRTIGELYPSRG